MRNSKSGSTPKTPAAQNEKTSKNAEIQSSGKKLKQARLPFKIIAASTSPISSKSSGSAVTSDKDAVKDHADGRKRKLSYDTDDDIVSNGLKGDDTVSKENVEILAVATKKKKVSALSSNDNISEVVSLVDDDDDEDIKVSKESANNSIGIASKKDLGAKTPQLSAEDKRKGAGTPKTTSVQKDKNGSASKLLIKLPLSGGKKKRRKSSVKNIEAEKPLHSSTQELSTDDDVEKIAAELNPHKRKKLNNSDVETKTPKTKRAVVDQEKEIETVAPDSESEATKKTKSNETLKPTNELMENEVNKTGNSEKAKELRSKNFTKSPAETISTTSKTKTTPEKSCDHENIVISDSSDDNEKQNDEKDQLDESVLSDNDNEADDETDNLAGKTVGAATDVGEKSKSKNLERIQKDAKSSSTAAKVLTPKQIKLTDRRKKAREEKERKLQEEKLKKQQEKEEKELARKREREEKEEQKRKEREEKEDQKRKEREEKERKRLAEVEAKNEEKRKKNEAKEEELRKKEEERKRKEQEKEEAELKKKKAAQAFTKFFVAKTPSNNQLKNDEDSNTGDGSKILAFMPFQIKGDMKLAPITRKNFTLEAKNRLDDLLGCKSKPEDDEDEIDIVRRKPHTKLQLYLSELRSGKILPGKWRRPSTESKDDVIFVEDELERVGQEIVEESPAYVREEMRVKYYKFHDNRRPPYYGTWRKKSSVVKPKKPFAQDKKFFDYEIDSDDEWEEEEPGESLEDGSDEDKEKESEDEDYEVDNEWFVPHGHLSDEEIQNEDESGVGDDNTREAQKAKLQLLQQEFAQEMKKKTEKIKPRLIGCIWADINGNQPPECAKILWDNLEKKAMLFVDPPLIEEPEVDRSSEANSPSAASNGNSEKASDKSKSIILSDNMVKDLSRLLHGNNHAKTFLINEYIAHMEKTEESIKSGDCRRPLRSVVRDKIEEIAEWQVVDAEATNLQQMEQQQQQQSNTETTNDKTKKKKVKRRLCWVVKQEILDKIDLSSLNLQNSWQYTLTPKFVKSDKTSKKDQTTTATETATATAAAAATSTSTGESNETAIEKTDSSTTKEKSTKSLNTPASNETSSNVTKSNTSSSTPKHKKRVPLLISVATGQHISTPAKNKLISQFLQQKNKDHVKLPPSSPITTESRSSAVTSPNIEDDDVVMLD